MKSIVIDTLASDLGPEEIARGILLSNSKLNFKVVGPRNILGPLLDARENVEIIDNNIAFGNDKNPMLVLSEKDSSISVASSLACNDDCVGLLSPGNTAAIFISAVQKIGMTKGVSTPVLASLLPHINGQLFCLLDCGANVNPLPKDLLLFARLGKACMSATSGKKEPKIALLSIGKERGKGNELVKTATPLLENSGLNFVGNVEADGFFQLDCDVIVCDGFSGNIILKNAESVAHLIYENFIKKHDFDEKNAIKTDIFNTFYYNEQAGAILLGTKKPVVKVHGKANRNTIAGAIKQLEGLYQGDFISKLESEFCDG